MYCSQCQQENPDTAQFCVHCGTKLGPVPSGFASLPTTLPTSRAAIVALVLGILTIVPLLGVLFGLAGLITGVVALVGIGRSGGRYRGKELAIIGLALSGGLMFLQVIPAAILFPVFAQAREQARSASCQSNLKQLSTGILMYAQDHNEQLPPAENWCDSILPYVKNRQIFHCPSAGEAASFGYAFNANLSQRPLSEILRPAETVLLFEAEGGWNASGTASDAVYRHTAGGDFAFADGHVKWYRPEAAQGLVWETDGWERVSLDDP